MTDNNNPHGDGPHFSDAYDRMLERIRTRMEEVEKDVRPTLHAALENAKETATELGELSREEADKVAAYLKRDLHDAAEFLNRNGKELKDWLRFDMTLVERSLGEMFANVADRTRMELDKLARRAEAVGEWKTGEVAGPGTLVCKGCGEELHFHKTGHIPPCPKCRGTRFRRTTE